MLVKMKRLDGARIAERGGNLRGFGREIRGQTLPHADHFEKISAIVGPEIVRLNADAVDQVRRNPGCESLCRCRVRKLGVEMRTGAATEVLIHQVG